MIRPDQQTDQQKLDWRLLERILRHYAEFEEFYHSSGKDELVLDNGFAINFHDLLQGLDTLSKRQRQAIVLTTLFNMREVDCARLMGLKWSSLASEYKREGLKRLADTVWQEEPDVHS